MAAKAQQVIWKPQPGPQAALVDCPIETIVYGGARGGGKTDGMIGKNALKAGRWGQHQKGVFFRRELPQLEHAIERCKEIYLPLGWEWAEQKKLFTAPNGATLRFRPLERDQDAMKYQGQDFTDLYFEEVTNWPDPAPIDRLRGSLRSAHGVPCQIHMTCNPGGPGHGWVQARYIDPAPTGYEVQVDDHGNEFVFIPAKVSDNRILTEMDPGYVDRLKTVGNDELVRAWLDGDWNIVEGAYFDWPQSIVVHPFEIPEDWTRFRSFDWGSAAPFSVGWWTVVGDDHRVDGVTLPRGALVRYREWYGAKSPNVGLKMTAEQVRDGILERERGENINYGVADPAIFAEDGGPSIAERMRPVLWKRADNKRIARHGSVGGWDQVRARMRDGMLFTFSTCRDSIRTIPRLQHDPNRPEDVDTTSEDHAADEWRYACMSRPYVQRPDTGPDVAQDAWGRYKRTGNNWKTL